MLAARLGGDLDEIVLGKLVTTGENYAADRSGDGARSVTSFEIERLRFTSGAISIRAVNGRGSSTCNHAAHRRSQIGPTPIGEFPVDA